MTQAADRGRTGAARGIGQAIALRLAKAGHTLALGDLHPADERRRMISGQTLRIDGGLVTL